MLNCELRHEIQSSSVTRKQQHVWKKSHAARCGHRHERAYRNECCLAARQHWSSSFIIIIIESSRKFMHRLTRQELEILATGMPIFVRLIVLKVRPQMPEGSRYDCFSAAGFRAAGKCGAGTLTLGAMISQ